jgi:hypothetical protein
MVDDVAGVLPSVFFELLLEIVMKTANSFLVSGRSNGRDGLVAGRPKLAEEKNKSGDTVKFESR